jgi:DNA uptake protein ComE-like DNA-binding protein
MRPLARAALVALALSFGAASAALPPTQAMAQASLIDINSASKEALESLKGVGPVRAEAIIKGRPYKGKDDLIHKKIVPQNVYDDIKDKIVARQRS